MLKALQLLTQKGWSIHSNCHSHYRAATGLFFHITTPHLLLILPLTALKNDWKHRWSHPHLNMPACLWDAMQACRQKSATAADWRLLKVVRRKPASKWQSEPPSKELNYSHFAETSASLGHPWQTIKNESGSVDEMQKRKRECECAGERTPICTHETPPSQTLVLTHKGEGDFLEGGGRFWLQSYQKGFFCTNLPSAMTCTQCVALMEWGSFCYTGGHHNVQQLGRWLISLSVTKHKTYQRTYDTNQYKKFDAG